MTESEWLELGAYDRNQFLYDLFDQRELQAFLCRCWQRAYDQLTSNQRVRVVQIASYLKPPPGETVGDIWEISQAAIAVALRNVKGLADAAECKAAADAALMVSLHYGDVAACAPTPDEDPDFDDASVKIGSDAASAASEAASIHPSAIEHCLRVVGSALAHDEEAYYAAAHGDIGFDQDHPLLVARRNELKAQWKLLREIMGGGSPLIE